MVLAALAGHTALATPDTPSATPDQVTSQRLLLSGEGPDDAVPWRFEIDGGRGVGERATIDVPSNWQTRGFGTYAYGQQDDAQHQSARYERDFEVPAGWHDRTIELVFAGVMTDATVTIDGESVGPTHRGGFTPFRYDITDRVRAGETHRLEVLVTARSSDRSVNAAERDADYWIFGGIYRPVWLEAHPREFIRRVAVDARADGQLLVEVDCRVASARPLRVAVLPEDPRNASVPDPRPPRLQLNGSCTPGATTTLAGVAEGVATWSAELPRLYTLQVELLESGTTEPLPRASATVQHRLRRRIGFRTVEVRPDGLYVNGRRTVLKGVNRHSFWPSTGRALSREQNRADVRRLRSLNFNAVRTAHSPPDESFLDACDELGLYVVDELPGWHDPYDTAVGRQVLTEMVRRDQHHPSIVLWSNGNEGGWNRSLDAMFGELDPQARPVLHPWAMFGGFETRHYPDWPTLLELTSEAPLEQRLARARFGQLPLLLPTEILHALYDGGGGAGLRTYWNELRRHPRFAGLFLWSLFDEGLLRPSDPNSRAVIDRSPASGEPGDLDYAAADSLRPDPSQLGTRWTIDTFGNYAADGILDPWRRAEASAAVVREVFSPVQLHLRDAATPEPVGAQPTPGSTRPSLTVGEALPSVVLRVDNRFDELDLATVSGRFEWLGLPPALEDEPVVHLLDARTFDLPRLAPGDSGSLRLTPSQVDSERPEPLRDLALRATLRRDDRPREPAFAEFSFELEPSLVRTPPLVQASPPASTSPGQQPTLQLSTQPASTAAAAERPRVELVLDQHGELLAVRQGAATGGLSAGRVLTLDSLSTSRTTSSPESTKSTALVVSEKSDRIVLRQPTDPAARAQRRFVDAHGTVRTWTLRGDGWIRLHVFSPATSSGAKPAPIGVQFEHASLCSARLTWLGRGPHRVWGNRRGGVLGVWNKALDTSCSEPLSASPGSSELDPAAGLYDAQWLRLELPEGRWTLLPALGELIGVGTPRFPDDAREARAQVASGVTVYGAAPPIGTKFHRGDLLGPEIQPPPAVVVWLRFDPTVETSGTRDDVNEAPPAGTR